MQLVEGVLAKADRPMLAIDIRRKIKGASQGAVSATLQHLRAYHRAESNTDSEGITLWARPGWHIPPKLILSRKWDRSLGLYESR